MTLLMHFAVAIVVDLFLQFSCYNCALKDIVVTGGRFMA